MKELKPCPFDGGKAHIVKYKHAGWCIACLTCNCEVYGADTKKDKFGFYTHKYWTKTQTIKAWNRRAS